MAVSGSGTKPMGSTIDPAMQDQTSYDARKGAPKRVQAATPITWGMKDMNAQSGVTSGVGGGKTGPDASSPNPLDPEPREKNLVRQPSVLATSWGMKGASISLGEGNSHVDGKDLHGMPQGTSLASSPTSGKVLNNAVLSGSSKLPDTVALKTDSGAAPKAFPAADNGG